MTTLTIKCPEGKTPLETNILKTFYRMYPALYLHPKDEIILTKKLFEEKYKDHICEIIDHEYQHVILNKLEGQETSRKLDNLLHEMLEWM